MGSVSVARDRELSGKIVKSLDGFALGRIDDLFYDAAGDRLKWIEIKRGRLISRRFLIPANGLEVDGEAVRTPFTQIEVEREPQFDWAGGPSPNAEAVLAEYFFLPEDERDGGDERDRSEERDF